MKTELEGIDAIQFSSEREAAWVDSLCGFSN